MLKISVVLMFAAAACLAQDEPPPRVMVVSGAMAVGAAGPVTLMRTEMRFGGPVVKDAPFSAETSNERVQTLPDGNHIRNTTTGKIYRDAEGRVRQEETMSLVGPWTTQGQPQTHTHIMISDPVAGVTWDLDQDHKVAHKLPNPAERSMTIRDGGGVGLSMGPQDVATLRAKLAAAPQSGNAQTEKLGTQVIEGVSAEGTRTTMTIPAGAMGNERPIVTVSERWYSPELQTLVMSTVNDPRMGESTYKLVNISRTDQPAMLFEVPSDYQVLDRPGFDFQNGAATTVSK